MHLKKFKHYEKNLDSSSLCMTRFENMTLKLSEICFLSYRLKIHKLSRENDQSISMAAN